MTGVLINGKISQAHRENTMLSVYVTQGPVRSTKSGLIQIHSWYFQRGQKPTHTLIFEF